MLTAVPGRCPAILRSARRVGLRLLARVGRRRRSSTFGARHSPEAASVAVSAARMEQLLEAEVTALALREVRPFTLAEILSSAAGNKADELAELLHDELPVRLAQRVKMLEALPDWENKETITHVRELYITSFKELRIADPNHPRQFRRHLRALQQRHERTSLLVASFKSLAHSEELAPEQVNEWLDRFFALRVSTNMLLSHYLHISRREGHGHTPRHLDLPPHAFDPNFNPYRSSIDPQCQPSRIARHAAHVVVKLCRLRYGFSPKIDIVDCGALEFPFVPRYLFYIVSELMKNSVRATVEQFSPPAEREEFLRLSGHEAMERRRDVEARLPPLSVLVSGDADVCSLRISDEGGGIPLDQLTNVWSYLYTTAEPIDEPFSRAGVDAPPNLAFLYANSMDAPCDHQGAIHSDFSDCEAEADALTDAEMFVRSPLAGLGCGLPLCRLYATYLGGSVEMQTLPRYGTDVFVYLSRLGNCAEGLPHL